MDHLAENIVNGNLGNGTHEDLKNFNEYFVNPNYDAFLIESATRSNCMLFTLMYIYHKQNWRTSLAQVS